MDPTAQQPQQPVNPQPVQPQVEQIQKNPQLPKILLSMLGVVIVLGLIGGAYYVGTQKNATIVSNEKTAVVPSKSVTVVPTSVVTPTPDITINWKMYNAVDNSYTFKYPNDSNWKLTEVNGTGFADIDVQCPHDACPQPYNIYDFSGGTASTLPNSIGAYISSLNTTNPSVNTKASPYIHDLQRIKINGLDAVETLTQTGKLAGSGPIITIFIVNKGKAYSFGYTYLDVNLDTVTKLSQLPKPNPDFISTFQFPN